MVNTRRSASTIAGTTTGTTEPPATEQVPPEPNSQPLVPPIPPLTRPQGTAPPGTESQGTNPLQTLIAPLGDRPLPSGAQISTTVLPLSTNPTYGLPNYPPTQGTGPSGHAPQIQEPYNPPYIRGLAPHHGPGYYDYSGPYTDESSSESDFAPRRRRASKEPEPRRRTRRVPDGPPQTAAERIKAHEAEIQKLKEDMAREQQRQNTNQPTSRVGEIPIVDLERPSRRERRLRSEVVRPEAPRGNPLDLMLPGDPDDPTPPFTEEVMRERISRKFKMPTIKAYDGTGDPAIHVRTFSNALLLQPASDALKCRAFPQTLAGMAQRWYSRLPSNSISSFRELSTAFIGQFVSGKVHEKSSAYLMQVTQEKNESLRDYLKRFTKETLNIPDLENKVAMIALQQGTNNSFFQMSLAKHPPENMTDLQKRASKYIKAEESMKKEAPATGGGSWNSKKRKTGREYDARDKYPRTSRDSESPSRKTQGPRFTEYAKLNAPRSQILLEIEKEKDFRWPKPLRGDPAKRNKDRYCRFHKDVGHDTDDCRSLKDEIEFLIRRGKLEKFTRYDSRDGQRRDDRNNERRNGDRRNDDRRNNDRDRNPQPRGPVINMISGGPTAAGSTRNSRKAYAREVMNIVGDAPKRAKTEMVIGFDDSDLEGVKFPHDDPLVIAPIIGNSNVKRVLIDSGASVDILFHSAFVKMGYNDSQLTPSSMPIYGFNGVESKIEGTIRLPMTIGQEPKAATQMLNFLVIKAASTYNAILGRTGLHAFKAVASSYHMKIKFPTRNGVGEHKGDQKMARSCYVTALKADGTGGQVLPINHKKVPSLTNPYVVHYDMPFGLKNAGVTTKTEDLYDLMVEYAINNQKVGGQDIIGQEGQQGKMPQQGKMQQGKRPLEEEPYFDEKSKTKMKNLPLGQP